MAHRIVVVGAGYAGLSAAQRAARALGDRADITVVNPARRFVERVRLHEVAAGATPTSLDIAEVLARRRVGFVRGAVTAVEPDAHRVRVETADGARDLTYDTLVHTVGSTADTDGVPGVARHALTVAGAADTEATRARVAELADGGRLTVVGGGSTGVELVAELAEAHPRLAVRLVTGEELGGWLSPRGRDHVRAVLDRLGVEVRDQTKVVEVGPDGVVLADGGTIAGDAVVWAAGFGVPPLARDAGLAVDRQGRVLVDDTLRSRSHPDVYAAGDAAVLHGAHGGELRMACATALPSGRHVADVITARLTARTPEPMRFEYAFQCLSLGRRDGLIQFVHGDDRPRPRVLTGRVAALFKEGVVRSTLSMARRSG
ncbi:NAD(P)/FAD-dependent oxidoreductase [Saccharothrix obliqua]|uniref:NAD(P)/FAD-dependent oxidoreductase n=1 Tax=Saccharothrix obliqua TaxID=2861747 RepID=UPI001C5E00FE|nr:FAD-dependent oxidoreductase [Saccharothrix obliqua]MBW4718572.1 FAD-dependent oxidoreductase [Saccharothrix obliqua]